MVTNIFVTPSGTQSSMKASRWQKKASRDQHFKKQSQVDRSEIQNVHWP